MQTLCVVAYPELAPADRDWIEGLRRRHDPNYRLVDAHLTLVFPFAGLEPEALAGHVGAVAAAGAPFAIALRCALIVRDALSELTHLFLVPDAGFSRVVLLHDALYRGVLASRLRLDVPYIPHITVGAFADPQAAREAADEINRAGPDIAGTVARLSVVAVESPRVRPLREIALGLANDE
ncbi:MAG TPA: 2'-5' RNA ligase family protein [Herpetosiphonaceae bacterium]|nr:2'-5' RNA ligase family protein [Herpetosiphonaceae bacterium]